MQKIKKGLFHQYTLKPEIKSIRIHLSAGARLELRPLKTQQLTKKEKGAANLRTLKVWLSHSPENYGEML